MSLHVPALSPALKAGPMCNPMGGTSVVLRDTIGTSLTVCMWGVFVARPLFFS